MPLHTLPYSSGAAWGTPRGVRGCGFMSGLLFVWPRAGRDVDRQEKGAEGRVAFGSGGRNHPWAVAGLVVARTVCCQQSHPAHVVVGAGIFWRTSAHKRSPVFRRWARHRIPLTTKGLRVARSLASHRGTLRRRAEEHTSELQSLMRISYA